MSHSTQVIITTSTCVGLDLHTGNRQLAEHLGIATGQCKGYTGEEAAALLNNREFLVFFNPSIRGLIAHVFSIEDAWEEEMNRLETPSWFNNETESYQHLSVMVHHRD